MTRPWMRTGLGLCMAAWYGSTGLPGQEVAPGPLPGVFSEVLDVRVVNLEVVVTDKDGVPVVGLRSGDFRLEVDGEEVPVEYFSEVRRGVAVARSASDQEREVREPPAVIAGDPVETSYLLFIDEYFSMAHDRDRVLKVLKDDLPRLGPRDRMAIVAFNGRRLEMLTTWTQQVPALERALDKSLERPTYGLQRLAEQRQFDFDQVLLASSQIRAGVTTLEGFLRTDLTPNERFYLERLSEQIQRSVTAATLAMRSFAMPPGRKVMLLLSGGWPFFPASFLGSNLSPLVLSSDAESGEGLFRPLTDTANLLGYTLYPVDVPGFNDLLAGTGAQATGADFIGVSPQVGPQQSSFLRQQEVRLTLDFLARETGGRAFVDSDRLEAFAEVVSDTRSYYWLGFTPQRDWDDRRHRVRITLREPGFVVRSRSGFLDSSKQHEVAMALESSLLFGHPAGSGGLRVEMGEVKRLGRNRMEVPVRMLIPLEGLTFLPNGTDYAAQVEIRVAVRDDQGRRAEIPVLPVVLRVASEPSEGSAGSYATTLKLRRRPHDAVIAVFDPASGRILSSSLEIVPPKKAE